MKVHVKSVIPVVVVIVASAAALMAQQTRIDLSKETVGKPPATFEPMKGSWTVTGDAAHCAIAYLADIEPAFWVPPLIGPALMRRRVEAQLGGVLEEIHRRAAAHRAP
jgi:hypothetical protein